MAIPYGESVRLNDPRETELVLMSEVLDAAALLDALLGPSQAALMSVLDLLSNVLGPVEVERLKNNWNPLPTPPRGTVQRPTCHGTCCQDAASRTV